MGAARSLRNYVGAITRVYRRSGEHFCGICRSGYHSDSAAHQCLRDCFTEYMQLSPVVRKPNGKEFRCRLCARDYTDANAAQACAVACRTEVENKFKRLAELEGVDLTAGAPRRASRLRKWQVIATPQKQQPAEENIPLDIAPPTETPEETATSAAAQEPEKKKKPDKKWVREGAEYVCTICQKHYYTKVETQQCFDSHPD
jgi:hypothetical protein